MANKSRYGKTTAKKNVAVAEEWEPIRIDSSAPAVDADRFDLFFIDDQAYTAPKRVSAGTALKALEVAFEKGAAAAAWFVMVETVGEEAIQELYKQPSLTLEDAQRMLAKLGEVFWGQIEDMVGKSPTGQDR